MADGGSGGHVDSIRQSGKSRTEQAILADSAGPSFINTLTITSNEEGRKKVSREKKYEYVYCDQISKDDVQNYKLF